MFQALANPASRDLKGYGKKVDFASALVGFSLTFTEVCCYVVLFKHLWNHDSTMSTILGQIFIV